MNSNYEKKLNKKGFKCVVGLDEAGRGAWAGPIVAGIVYIPNFRKKFLKNIKDSKKLSPTKREELFELINENYTWSIGVVTVKEIDKIGIGKANKLALERAVENIKLEPDYLLIDYFKNINTKIPVEGIKYGDNKILSIAAASIVAKVFRDQLMKDYHLRFRKYRFDKHKGYGSKLHQERLKRYGVCKLHRRSFQPIKDLI